MKNLIFIIFVFFFFLGNESFADDSVNTSINDLYGRWMPISTAAASIVGPIEISENKFKIGGGNIILLKNSVKDHKFYEVFGKDLNQYVITYGIISKTDIISINGNKLCQFNADKIHFWIEKQYDPMRLRGPENVLKLQMTKGPASFAKLGKENCGTYSYSKMVGP